MYRVCGYSKWCIFCEFYVSCYIVDNIFLEYELVICMDNLEEVLSDLFII